MLELAKKYLDFKKIALLSLGLHFLAAIFSTGFHHFDEHFQIYEFLNFRLGHIPATELPWEFATKIRPWFQVFCYYWPTKILMMFGVSSPFIIAFCFRLLTTLLGWFALMSLLPLLKQWFREELWQKIAWACLHLAWFVPYIQTRTNSESFATSFFILGFVALMQIGHQEKKSGHAVLAGIFLGASYASRYQVALMVMFFWIWCLVFQHIKRSYLIFSALGIAAMIGLGVVFDYWGYGAWTFAPWNLYYMDVVQGVLKSTGETPWWEYFRTTFLRGIPPLSLIFILGTLGFWAKYYKHPLTWSTVPFVLFHCLIGHKELRYIFPAVMLAPTMTMLLIYEFRAKLEAYWKMVWLKRVLAGLVVLNGLALIFSVLRPANPAVDFYRFLYQNKVKKIYLANSENPYSMVGLPIHFYRPPGLEIVALDEGEQWDWYQQSYVFVDKGPKLLALYKDHNCELLYASYPLWMLNYNVGNWLNRSRVWGLFVCQIQAPLE